MHRVAARVPGRRHRSPRTAEFFCFGTNDLTQTTFGYSRDDAEGKFLGEYLDRSAAASTRSRRIDRDGVGELMRIGIERGRQQRPDLEVGICGEHGGDPASVAFCHELGMNYVSCAPGPRADRAPGGGAGRARVSRHGSLTARPVRLGGACAPRGAPANRRTRRAVSASSPPLARKSPTATVPKRPTRCAPRTRSTATGSSTRRRSAG